MVDAALKRLVVALRRRLREQQAGGCCVAARREIRFPSSRGSTLPSKPGSSFPFADSLVLVLVQITIQRSIYMEIPAERFSV